jgi:hypothetical protein
VTTRETLLQTCIDWFEAALTPDINPTSTSINAFPHDDKGPRPVPPYLTFKLTLADQAVGVDEQVNEIGALPDEFPTVRTRGTRRGTLSVQGFGSKAAGWLEVATLRLRRPSIQAILDAAGLTVVNRGGVSDISALLDNEIEPRFLREFELGYAVVDADTEDLVEMKLVEADITFIDREGDPDPLTTTIVVDLT